MGGGKRSIVMFAAALTPACLPRPPFSETWRTSPGFSWGLSFEPFAIMLPRGDPLVTRSGHWHDYSAV